MKFFCCRNTTLALVCIIAGAAPAQSRIAVVDLPEAPRAAPQAGSGVAGQNPSSDLPHGSAQVQGVAQDVQGNPIAEAQIILSAPGKVGERTAVSGTDGRFHFGELPAGEYRIIVTAPGLVPYTSGTFAVRTADNITVPPIAMKISSTTSINVVATENQVAVAQVHEQEKQRVLGVFPNFYTSYIWDAKPMPASQKYKLALRTLVDPFQLLIVSGVAGAEQFNGTYPGYGPGIEGYGKRFGASLADTTTGRILGSAVFPSLLHQDPRYFYQGSGGFRSRALHAVASTFVTRGDNGKNQPNYSHFMGNLAAGGIANLYHPSTSRGVGLTFETFGIGLGANAISNLFREFVLRGLVPSVPSFANGKQ